ncbi:DUF2382 domain-containing protein [Exiguobacterium flavidum]|uniref:DUF2382 domain-containing protein n=1 Tax=Exiguobacterium flavidum TaxID=2184695 RepID=UPI000DF7E260|nr:DUF2382 domain-containing protein [Exiguobacterium flavidum]
MERPVIAHSYGNEQALMERARELQAQGYPEDKMYVVTKNPSDARLIQSQTGIHVREGMGEESIKGQLSSIVSGENGIRRLLATMNLTGDQIDQYEREVKHGALFLYADPTYVEPVPEPKEERQGTPLSPASEWLEKQKARFLTKESDIPVMDEPPMTGSRLERRRNGGKPVERQEPERVQQKQEEPALEAERTHLPHDREQTGAYKPEHDTTRHEDHHLSFDREETTPNGTEQTMELHEEQLRIDKERVQTGEVVLDREVIEEEQVFDVPVVKEEVIVERNKIEQPIELDGYEFDRPGIRTIEEGDHIRIQVIEERVVLVKKPVVVEEIVIRKEMKEHIETIREQVRREEFHVRREDGSEERL